MTYDQIQPLKETLRQRLDGTSFITFTAPKDEANFKAFMLKIEAVAELKNTHINEILDNPETVRNQLDQVPDQNLEIYVKSIAEDDNFMGTLDEYRQKYHVGSLQVAGYEENSDQ